MKLVKIHNWSTKSIGGKLTINGIDDKGDPIKVTKVDSIQHTRVGPLAVRSTGEHYRLA